jgi:hypothetical protein
VEAVEAFRDTISEKDKKYLHAYGCSKDMLTELTASIAKHKNRGRLSNCCYNFAVFSRAFEPYFEIVNIFVQVKPDIAGLVWGSLRLIFAVGGINILL